MKRLFQGGRLVHFLSSQRCKLIQELQALGPNYLLRMNEEELCGRLISKYHLRLPRLKPNDSHIYSEPAPAINPPAIERGDSPGGDPAVERGSDFICLAVPFEGDAKLFAYRPSPSHNDDPPAGEVVGSKILLHLRLTEASQDQSLRHNYKQIIESVETYLRGVREEAARYNESLELTVRRNLVQLKMNFHPPHEHAFADSRRSRAATQAAR